MDSVHETKNFVKSEGTESSDGSGSEESYKTNGKVRTWKILTFARRIDELFIKLLTQSSGALAGQAA